MFLSSDLLLAHPFACVVTLPDVRILLPLCVLLLTVCALGLWLAHHLRRNAADPMPTSGSRATRQLLSHLKTAALQSGLSVWMLDLREQRILQDYNAQEIEGFPRVIGQVPQSLIASGCIHPDDHALMQEMYARLYGGESIPAFTLRWKSPLGSSYRWRRISYTLLYDPSGRPLHAIGSSIDVTEQKLIEQRYDEELLRRTMLEASSLGSLQFNLTRNSLVSSNFLEITGYSCPAGTPSLEVLRSVAHRFSDEDASDFQQTFSLEALRQEYQSGRRSFIKDYRVSIAPQDARWISMQVNMLEQPGTGDLMAFLYASDIDDQKLRQLALQSVIADEVDFLAIIDGRDGRCRCIRTDTDALHNPQRMPVVSYTDATLAYLEQAVRPEDRDICRKELALPHVVRELARRPSYSVMHLSDDAEDTQKMLKTRFSYLDRARHLIVQVRHDITDIYRSERAQQVALQGALDDSRRANAAKSEFLSRMSHDIRTPMNGILGMTYLALQEADDPAAVRDYLGKIISSGNYLLGLINDVLDMSKIESDKMQLRQEPVALRRFLTDIFTLIQPLLTEKHQQFVCTPALEQLPAHTVLTDPLRLQQVLMNLLSNALKFTPDGGRIELSIEPLAQREDVLTLRLRLRDTGIGMSPTFLPKLFLPFEQEAEKHDTAYAGTGLGMAIVKNLIDLMGGTISADSILGTGTTFTLVLPFRLAADAPDVGSSAEQPTLPAPLAGRRILLAEDHPINAEIARKLLQRQGMQVDHAENGRLALEAFRDAPIGTYDAILMDIRMPEMDGLEATRAIRALDRPDAAAIPILAMTANAFAEDVEKSAWTGMTAHLSKPIMPDLLYRTLSEEIARRERAEL